MNVHQDEIGLVLCRELDAVFCRSRFERRIALHLQHVADELQVLLVVFDDQDDAHCWEGIVNVNVEPWPGSLSTQMRPPCSSTNFLVSARPSPVPSCLRV